MEDLFYIVVDWVGRKIYLVNEGGFIEVFEMDGFFCYILINEGIEKLSVIVVDFVEG